VRSSFCWATRRSKARLEGLGLDVVANSQKEFWAQIKQEIVKWSKVIQAANIKVE